jgi:hypothetical protein
MRKCRGGALRQHCAALNAFYTLPSAPKKKLRPHTGNLLVDISFRWLPFLKASASYPG